VTESPVQTTVDPEAILLTDGGEDEEAIQTKMPQLMLDKFNKTVFVVTAVDIEHMNNTPTWITPPPTTTPSSVASEIPPSLPAVTIQTNFTSTPPTPATVEMSTPSAGPSGIPDSTRMPVITESPQTAETSTASVANNGSANLAEFNATLFQSAETVPQRQGLDYLGVSRGSCTSSR
jgi:hypothetical protein